MDIYSQADCKISAFLHFLLGGRQKNGYFTVRLTVSVYPPPPYSQLFVNFSFDVFSILDYDSMCSETDFTQEKSIFMQLLESPIPPLSAAHLIVGGYF